MKTVKMDYGLSCGRNWVTINGKEISQTGGADIYMRDEDVAKIIKTVCDPDWKVYVYDGNHNLVEWERDGCKIEGYAE